MSNPKVILVISALTSLAAAGMLWLTEIPLGIPGEWVWERIPYERAGGWDLIPFCVLCVLVGGIYVFIAARGLTKIAGASIWATAGWLLMLAAAGFLWLFAVQLSPPAPYGLARSPWVLYDPGASGYFHEARFHEEPLGGYLASYDVEIQTEVTWKRVGHHGTHPPGLFMGYRGLIWLCERSPNLTQAVIATQPPRVEAMFDEIEFGQRMAGKSFRESDRAVVWLAALLTQLCGSLVVVPLFFLARQIASKKAAWIASAFWPLVPALAVFLPKSDVLYAFFGTLFLAVWSSGWRRGSLVRCFLAGAIFWFGMMFSLALLPVAFLAFLLMGWELFVPRNSSDEVKSIRNVSLLIAAGAAGFLLPAIALSWSAKMNLAAVWWQNYQNHAEFYQHYPRSYWAWLWANPIETFFSLGAPLGVLFLAAYWRRLKERKPLSSADWGPYLAFAVMMGLLWLTGKNRGEAARLWIVVFPYFVWLSAGFWDTKESLKTADPSPRLMLISGMLVLQMLVSWMTVARIHGFPL